MFNDVAKDELEIGGHVGPGFNITHGDSRQEIRLIQDQSVDLILTDPPYNLAKYSTGNIQMPWRSEFNNGIASWDQETFNPAEWLAEFQRILKPTGNIFAFTSYNLLGEWHKAFDPVFDTFNFMAWHKLNPPPKLRRAGFLNSVELIVCMWNKGHTWGFTKQAEMHNFIECGICQGKERVKDEHGKTLHSTQKPLKLLRHIIRLASNPGDLVIDPFMGVGSTGVAALELGRRFVGFELEDKYYQAAVGRLWGVQR